ncbi:MAG: hypothetical protein WCO35_00515 [Candidatus Nomurabacteria bacterium]
MKFYKINYLLNKIESVNQVKCKKIFEDHKDRFLVAPGSLAKHQNWKGGYIDHLEEIMSMAYNFYGFMFKERKPDFTLSDSLLVLFLHDLEKPFKYVEPKTKFTSDLEKEEFINSVLKEYKIKLNNKQKIALKYIHGEGEDHNSKKRIQNPLGAFCHMCDNNSARIWFSYPNK